MQAIIFAAGLGTRFKPWTDFHPKALAVVNGKSLLQRNIEYLQAYGIREVVVNVHHFADQIETAIEQHQGWGSRVRISDERGSVLETGGGLLNAESLFQPGKPILSCNADFLTDLNIQDLVNFHNSKEALISFAVSNRKSSRYLLFDENMRLRGWENVQTGETRPNPLPRSRASLQAFGYDCVVVYDYRIFDRMREKGFSGKFSIIDVYLALAEEYPIYGYDHTGDRVVDVGKPESVALAEALFP